MALHLVWAWHPLITPCGAIVSLVLGVYAMLKMQQLVKGVMPIRVYDSQLGSTLL